MSERKIEVVISAKDDYTIALARFNEAVGKMDGMNSRLAGSTSKVEKEYGKLTSASNFAASGLMRFRTMMERIAFGGAIGLVSGAVGVLTETLIAHWKENSAERIDGISSAVAKQAGAWKLLPEPLGGATSATIALYNAQLKYLQLVSQDEGSVIKKQIENLEQMRRTSEINMMAFPNRAAYFRKEIANFDIKLSEARVNYEKWLAIMGQTPATIAQVTAALSPAAKAIKSALELPKGGGSLMAFVMGDLDMAKPKLELTGLELSKVFMDSFQQGAAEANKVPGPGDLVGELDYNQKYITRLQNDSDYNQAYFALLDERYNREAAYEDALLDRGLAFSEQRFQIESRIEQQIMNLKFAAANQGIALLNIVGQKSKALAMAALIFQKGLAIAQVMVQTQTAAAAALAPPPLGLGPVFGAPLAASVLAWGKISMGLIAATGLAEIAMGGGGPSGVGGGGGVGALPIAAPTLREEDSRKTQTINITIHTLTGAIDGKAQEEIIRAINEAGDRDVKINSNVIAVGA